MAKRRLDHQNELAQRPTDGTRQVSRGCNSRHVRHQSNFQSHQNGKMLDTIKFHGNHHIQKIIAYQIDRVTIGNCCSWFIAIHATRAADDFGNDRPNATKAMKRILVYGCMDIYMD